MYAYEYARSSPIAAPIALCAWRNINYLINYRVVQPITCHTRNQTVRPRRKAIHQHTSTNFLCRFSSLHSTISTSRQINMQQLAMVLDQIIIANRTGLTFYDQMLRDNRVLRRACAYRNILDDVIDQWKKRPPNAGDPRKECCHNCV